MKNLENYGVQELDAKNSLKINGGEMPWWSYLIAPGTAYILDRFLEGYENYEC